MNVAFIPVRGGSKSIPLKNIKLMAGKPLVYWTVKAACECAEIDKVYVATDSEHIVDAVNSFSDSQIFHKVNVIGRSEESASDTASTEFAMLEFAMKYDFDTIVLIQATSPLLTGKDLTLGFEYYSQENVDSVISVVEQKRFIWKDDENGYGKAENYDIYNRPRRQDYDGYLVENGAFYITGKERLLRTKNRISGNIKTVKMDESTFYEIDEPGDWVVIENLLKQRLNDRKEQPLLSRYKMLLSDCDGCLTDGGMYYTENGDEVKKFNTRDGVGFALAKEHGLITGIVTGEDVDLNFRRATKMKLDILKQGCNNKIETIKEICDLKGFDMSDVIYIGDDVNDLEVIKSVGYSCCPKDAMPVIRQHADYVSELPGGRGVVREIVDMMIKNN